MRSTLALVASISCFFVFVDGRTTEGASCPPNTWGPECKPCLCKQNAQCSLKNGSCTCTPGFEGKDCEKSCDEGYYGYKCQNKCHCLNGASCETRTGKCLCSAGYQGINCNTTCPEGTYGFECQENCACPINKVCSPIDGSCRCKKNIYNGTHCTCDPKNSIQICSQLGICNLTTGACSCQEGYTGESCAKLHCGKKNYVLGCHGHCKCQYNVTCYENDGSCYCLPGWIGKSCNDSCPDGRYGNYCQSICTCNNSKSCDHVTGECNGRPDNKSLTNSNDGLLPLISIIIVIIPLICVIIWYKKYRVPHETNAAGGQRENGQNQERPLVSAEMEGVNNQEDINSPENPDKESTNLMKEDNNQEGISSPDPENSDNESANLMKEDNNQEGISSPSPENSDNESANLLKGDNRQEGINSPSPKNQNDRTQENFGEIVIKGKKNNLNNKEKTGGAHGLGGGSQKSVIH